MSRVALSALWLTYLTWVVTQIWIGRHDQAPKTGDANDRGSRVAIMIGMFAGVFVAAKMAAWFPAATIASADLLLVVGLTVAWSGFALHLLAVRILGRYFRTIVIIQPGHELVTAGPYRFLRHPSYTGALVSLGGMGLLLDNWPALAAALLIPLPAFLYRIHVEERAMAAKLGRAYEAYRAARWALVPGLW
jgi:protein-S-isoprenylcysteine O-methyltransferase Ste14